MHAPSPRPDRLLLGLAALYVAIRLGHLARWDLWFDELFGVGLGALDWKGLLDRAAADQTNPPLFYLLLKGWMAILPLSAPALRLLPFLASLLALPALDRLGRVLALGPAERRGTLALAAVSPILVFYAVELRAYALLFTLATAATAECAALVLHEAPDRRVTLRLMAWNLLLPLTHYFGWTVIAAEGVAVLLLRPARWRTLLLAVLPALLCFLPWALLVLHAVGARHELAPTIGWIARPGVAEVLEAPGALLAIGMPVLVRAAGAVVLAALVWGTFTGPEAQRPTRHLLAAFVFVPAAAALVASWLLPRSLWVPRNLIGSAAPALVLLVLVITRQRRPVALAALGGALTLAAIGLGRADGVKTPWRAFAAQLDRDPPVTVWAYEGYVALPLTYHASVDGRAYTVRLLDRPIPPPGNEGWLVARTSAWPGAADPARAFAAWGLHVTDSVETGTPGEVIRGWRWRR